MQVEVEGVFGGEVEGVSEYSEYHFGSFLVGCFSILSVRDKVRQGTRRLGSSSDGKELVGKIFLGFSSCAFAFFKS